MWHRLCLQSGALWWLRLADRGLLGALPHPLRCLHFSIRQLLPFLFSQGLDLSCLHDILSNMLFPSGVNDRSLETEEQVMQKKASKCRS